MTTRSKRASSVGIGLFWLLAPPFPDGTLDQGDRQHAAISYSGVLAGAPVPTPVPAISEDRFVTVESVDRWVIVP